MVFLHAMGQTSMPEGWKTRKFRRNSLQVMPAQQEREQMHGYRKAYLTGRGGEGGPKREAK
jgi:hypothetical protein